MLRKELTSLLLYARVHYIYAVLVTELSRLGRVTLQVLAAIDMLNKAKVGQRGSLRDISKATGVSVNTVLSAVFTAIIKQYPDSFGEFVCMSPKERKTVMKREYQRRYYASHKEELQRKSREYHRQLRVNKNK